MIELRRVRPDAVPTHADILSATRRLATGWTEATEPLGTQCDIELIKQLSQNAATFFHIDQMDAWLAPRLHSALRIPRRLAVDDGMWAWLAFQCSAFVEARFRKGKERLHPWRYGGSWSRNALARLWWGAEMTRNGSDYEATMLCFRRTRTAQFALELMYSWDRAAAIAFCRVAEGADGGDRLSDFETNKLSTSLKVLLTLRALDGFGNSATEEGTEEFDERWAAHRPSFAELTTADIGTIRGPSNGTVSEAKLRELTYWLRSIVESFAEGLDEHEAETAAAQGNSE